METDQYQYQASQTAEVTVSENQSAQSKPQPQPQPQRRHTTKQLQGTTSWRNSILYKIVVMSGSIFFSISMGAILVGFQGLLPLLIDEGVYRERCQPQDPRDEACPKQAVALQSMMVAAVSTVNGANLVVGPLSDVLGPRVMCCLGSCVIALSLVLFAFSNSIYFDAFVPSFAIQALGGVCVVMSTISTPNLFANAKLRSIMQTMLMSSQDTGAIVFFIMQQLYFLDRVTFSRRNMFLAYSLMAVALFLFGLLLPGKSFVPLELEAPAAPSPSLAVGESSSSSPRVTSHQVEEEEQALLQGTSASAAVATVPEASRHEGLRRRAFSWLKVVLQQMCRIQFLFLIIYGSIMLTVSFNYIQTLRDQLIWQNSSGGPGSGPDFVNNGTRVFSILMFFLGAICAPILGAVTQFGGPTLYAAAIGCLFTLAGIFSCILVPGLQYATFCLYIIGRASMFGFWLGFASSPLNFTAAIGTIIGVSTFVAALVNTSNYLWAYVFTELLQRQYLWMNIGMTIASTIATVLMVMYMLGRKVAQRVRVRAQQRQIGA